MFTRPLPIDAYERVNGALDVLTEVFGAGLFIGDNLMTFDRILGFAHEPAFLAAYAAAKPTVQERAIVWRVHIAAWAARRGLSLSGDFVDFGARQGLEAAVIGRMLEFERSGRQWVLFDSFDTWRFEPFPGGGVASSDLTPFLADRVSFMPNAKPVKLASLLDLDSAAPSTIAYLRVEDPDPSMVTGAIAKLFPRLVSGGSLIIEGYASMLERAALIDRYLQHLDHPVLELPTGQGLIVKR